MKLFAILVAALVIAAGGVALAIYSEADDAPGGVVIGVMLVIGALVLGLRTSERRR